MHDTIMLSAGSTIDIEKALSCFFCGIFVNGLACDSRFVLFYMPATKSGRLFTYVPLGFTSGSYTVGSSNPL